MKCVIHREHAIFSPGSITHISTGPRPREFDASFDGFRTAIGEEGAIQARDLAQLLGEAPLILVVKKIRDVQWPLDLLSQNLFDAGMVVAKRVHADARKQVKVSLVCRIDQIGAASTLDEHVVARVCSENVFLFEFFDV
jgi:hypothetical protein